MVSVDRPNELDYQYQWIAVVLAIATTISMVTSIVYCACCQWLFAKSSNPTASLKSLVPDKKKKLATTQKGTSPATATKYQQSVQQPQQQQAKRKPKKNEGAKKKSLGRLQIHIAYFRSKSMLEVTVMCAQNLPAKDVSGTSDPYCKLLLLPANDKKISTQVKSKTLSPVWNETVRFSVAPAVLDEQTLYVYVLDRDMLNQDDMIGECRFNLCSLEQLSRGQVVWRELRPSDGYASHLGEILLSLCYSASQEKLTINVLKCSNLKAMDANNSSDPYVKLFHWRHGKKHGKQKTRTLSKNRNPVFNESFTFEIALTKIHSSQILVEVMDYDRMSANDKIGCVLLGEGGEGGEALHWREMCNNMDKAIAQWHRLKADITT